MAWFEKGIRGIMRPMTEEEKQRAHEREIEEEEDKRYQRADERLRKKQEADARHLGNLKYIEREAAKGKTGGGFWDIGGGIRNMAANAADASFGPSSGGRRRGNMPGSGFTLMSELGPSGSFGEQRRRRPARRHHKRVSRRAPSGRPRKVVYY